ncbi:MAG: hypothetical protein ABIS37_03415 [Bacteroidia bacterium]
MEDIQKPKEQNSRRNFLRVVGLTAGTVLVSTSVFSSFIDKTEVLKLNPAQQEFMLRYGKWMDDFIDVIRKKKAEPGNQEHHKVTMTLSDKAAAFKPELTEHLKDKNFEIVYRAAIDRMSKEIT